MDVWARSGQALVFSAAILAGGCSAVKHIVDMKYPPVDPERAQLAATKAATAQLGSLASPNAYAAIAAKDLSTYLPRAIVVSLAMNPDSKDAGRLSNVKVELGKQEVVVRAEFDVVFDEQTSHAAGSLEIHCAAAVENGALVLRPAATGLIVTEVRYRKTARIVLDVVKPLINAAARHFLDNVSGAIGAQAVPIGMYEERAVDLKQEIDAALKKSLKDAPDGSPLRDLTVLNLQGSKVQINVALGRAAVLVDPDGVHAIGEVVSLNQTLFDQVHAEMKATAAGGPSAPFTSAQLAYLSGCPARSDDPALPPPANQRDVEYRDVCRALRARSLVAAPTPSGGPIADVRKDFAAAFPAFVTAFQAKAATLEKPSNLGWGASAIAVRRDAFTSILGDVLRQVSASGAVAVPDQSLGFRNTIYTDPAPDLKCDQNAGACHDFEHPPYHPRGCDSNCSGWELRCIGPSWARICSNYPSVDLACQARKIDCERLKAQEGAAYDLARAAAWTKWKVEHDACELVKAAKLTGCRINQGWLSSVAHLDVGEVRGTVHLGAPSLHLALGQVALAPNLTGLSLHLVASAGTKASADFTVVPHNLGTLACYKQFDGSVHADVTISVPDQQMSAALKSVQPKGDALSFVFTSSPFDFDVKSEPPTAKALIEQNAATLVTSCPVPASIAAGLLTNGWTAPVAIPAAIKIAQDIQVPGRSIHVDAKDFGFDVKPIAMTLGADEKGQPLVLSLAPSWFEGSVVFAKK